MGDTINYGLQVRNFRFTLKDEESKIIKRKTTIRKTQELVEAEFPSRRCRPSKKLTLTQIEMLTRCNAIIMTLKKEEKLDGV